MSSKKEERKHYYLDKGYEKKLKKYLSIFLSNIHAINTDSFAGYWFSDLEAKTLKKYCLNQGYIKSNSITDKGIKLLNILENKEVSKKQLYFNIIILH